MYVRKVNKKELGKRLRAHRESPPKITLSALAKETKALTASGISNYEQGIRLLKSREAKILADAFARLGKPVTPAKLLGIEMDSAPVHLTKEAIELAIKWDQLTSSAKKEVIKFIEWTISQDKETIRRIANLDPTVKVAPDDVVGKSLKAVKHKVKHK